MSYISCKKSSSEYLKNLTTDKEIRKMLCHVLSGCLYTNQKHVKIPYQFINTFFGDSASFRAKMRESKLFTELSYVKPGSVDSTCYSYGVIDSVVSEFLKLEQNARVINQMVCCLSGKPYIRQVPKYDENNNKLPKLLIDSMCEVKGCKLNIDGLSKYLTNSNLSGSEKWLISSIINHSVDGYFAPSFVVSDTGRIFEKFGLQNCSKVARRIALEDTTFVNYDLRSSQATYLLAEFDKENIKCNWLERYINDSEFRERCYATTGKEVWKTLFYSLCFGGKVFPSLARMNFTEAGKKISDKQKSLGKQESEIEKLFVDFCKETSEFAKCLESWKNLIVSDVWLKDKITYAKGKRYFTNACGLKFCLDKYDIEKTKRMLAARILQGKESLFIHTLTLECSSQNIAVFSNQHDGLIVDKEIPQSIIETVKNKTSQNVFFDIKEL